MHAREEGSRKHTREEEEEESGISGTADPYQLLR
jgi:hypothetical protein